MKLRIILIFFTVLATGSCIQTYYMDLNCGKYLDFSKSGLYQIRLKFTSRSSYRTNTDCDFYLKTGYAEKFMFYFKSVKTQSCSHASINVFDGNTTSTSRSIIRKCGYLDYTSNIYTTNGNALTLNFRSDNYAFTDKGFDMIITSYHYGSCNSYEYSCDNGRCIYDELTCNGYNPCGDNSDCPLTGGAIAGIVIGCFTFVVVTTTLLICIRRRRRRRYIQRTIVTENISYGTTGYGYNQPPTTTYPTGTVVPPPAYPAGQQYPPPQPQGYPGPPASAPYPQSGPMQYPGK